MICNGCGKRIVPITGTMIGWIDKPCHKGYREAKQELRWEDDV